MNFVIDFLDRQHDGLVRLIGRGFEPLGLQTLEPKAEAVALYPRHKPHLAKNEDMVYRGISGEQFHGNKAS
ncbi:hypothetical protein BKM17_13455 [Pseudomonas syringae group genomosp. 3]|nr:hypothetical protein BKM17_13455 [Pseudomonas syringae group genomosp. 3]